MLDLPSMMTRDAGTGNLEADQSTEDAQAWQSDGFASDSERDSCLDEEIESDDPDIAKLVTQDGRALSEKLASEVHADEYIIMSIYADAICHYDSARRGSGWTRS
jgi:hypothetical protein